MSSLEDLPDSPLALAHILQRQGQGGMKRPLGRLTRSGNATYHVEQLRTLHRDEIESGLVGDCLSGDTEEQQDQNRGPRESNQNRLLCRGFGLWVETRSTSSSADHPLPSEEQQ